LSNIGFPLADGNDGWHGKVSGYMEGPPQGDGPEPGTHGEKRF
jgi:hypothetical protein